MMTDDEFDAFLAHSVDQLRHKQDRLTDSNGLGSYPDFWFDQEKGTLQFKDADGNVAIEATIIPIGSFSAKSSTWQWSWANQSVLGRLREKAESLKGLFDLTGMNIFQMQTINADEEMAWELAAMSVRYLESLGCYRIPVQDHQLLIFLAIETIAPQQTNTRG